MLFTSTFRVHFYDTTYIAHADRVHGLHGHRIFGTALQPFHRVRETVRVHVNTLLSFVARVVVEHVCCGHGVRLFDRLPLDPDGAGRYRIYGEFGRQRRVEYVDCVRYLIPAEYVLHVARVIARV